jgi:hypothetical protein
MTSSLLMEMVSGKQAPPEKIPAGPGVVLSRWG